MDATAALLKVRTHLDECREILDTARYGSSDVKSGSDEAKLLDSVYDSICKTEDLFI